MKSLTRYLRYVVTAVCCVALVQTSLAQDEEVQPTPLDEIATRMAVVVRDLSRLSTGKPTQAKQQTVKKKLDDLIAELEKERDSGRGSSGSNVTRPLKDSVIMGGPGGIGDLRAPREGGKKWGELPPHERDRILQSMTEGFPPHYQRVLERYYRQLAEEKPAGEAREESDAPAEKPAATEGVPAEPAAKPAAEPATKPAADPGAEPAADAAGAPAAQGGK